MKNRTDASGWLYERGELHGIELWGTGAILDHSTIPKGLYCYDIYSMEEPVNERNSFISKEPVDEGCIGAILTAKPLPFHKKEALSMRGIHYFDEEYMKPLEEIAENAAMTENLLQSGFQMQEM